MLVRGLCLLSLYVELGVYVQAQGSICSSGIFPALKQTLGSHPEVLAYCEAHFPVAPATLFKRNAKSKCPPRPNPSTTTAPQQPGSTTTSRPGNKLDELLALAPHLIETACSCIQGQATVNLAWSILTPLGANIDGCTVYNKFDLSTINGILFSIDQFRPVYNNLDLSIIHGILFFIDNYRPIFNYRNEHILHFDFSCAPCAHCGCSTLQQFGVHQRRL
ncbi:unnamed protein product [Clonostachys byssicola]|uniref:Secreted protein n=1 Tax=Clonostachys byssicola TaxID=160290 RepID=A0A9N9UDN7_9HYPO|nr:unnamed protein product [Clonostachys byssicola]